MNEEKTKAKTSKNTNRFILSGAIIISIILIISFSYVSLGPTAGIGDLGPKNGTLEDIEFRITMDDTYQLGEYINVSCMLTNIGDNSINLTSPALTHGNLNFY
ncbi:MAG: hypothetical protein KAX31_03900, partial [Thermoplasmata archaeon]|nr:hypothetical protein [Thermoplasmata archaeon]